MLELVLYEFHLESRNLMYTSSMKAAVDLTKVLGREHEQKWVALSRDNKRVIAYNEDLIKLDKQVEGQDVVFMKVPASDSYLSF